MAQGQQSSLTGVWEGFYEYPVAFPPTPFTAILLELGSSLTGSVHEVSEHAPIAGQTVTALLDGSRSGSSVLFVKTYEVDSPYYKPVHYSGELSGDQTEIEGEWSIPGAWSGRFLMVRPKPAPLVETLERREVIPVK